VVVFADNPLTYDDFGTMTSGLVRLSVGMLWSLVAGLLAIGLVSCEASSDEADHPKPEQQCVTLWRTQAMCESKLNREVLINGKAYRLSQFSWDELNSFLEKHTSVKGGLASLQNYSPLSIQAELFAVADCEVRNFGLDAPMMRTQEQTEEPCWGIRNLAFCRWERCGTPIPDPSLGDPLLWGQD
jgi:hypothetical protein